LPGANGHSAHAFALPRLKPRKETLDFLSAPADVEEIDSSSSDD
jgi:hypothetical protein